MKATALVCDENQDFTLELVRLGGPAPHQVVIRTHYTGVRLTTVRMAVRTTVILSALGSRWDHLVQEVRDGQRSASTTTEAEDYGRKDSTGISGSGGYEHKERSQVAERSVAVGEE